MKSKKFIKTVDDIKYCEENNIILTDLNNKKAFYIFDNNTWIWSDSKTSLYNVQLSLDGTLYYYEEQQKKVSQKDIGKLCWFVDNDGDAFVAVLEDYNEDTRLPYTCSNGWYKECRPLTKEEIKEFMEKAE